MRQSIDDLRQLIEKRCGNSELTIEESKRIVDSLSSHEQIIALIQNTISNKNHLERIASRSYTHSNGFDKFVLLTSDNPQYKLRLHIWWPDVETSFDEHIHNHSWNFSSAVITGALRFFAYDSQNGEIIVNRYECGFPEDLSKGQEIDRSDIGYRMRYIGNTSLSQSFSVTLAAGSSYSLFHNTLHKVANSVDALTSTIVLHGDFLRNTSDLYSNQGESEPKSTNAKKFTPSEVVKKFEKYLHHLQRS